MQLFAGLNSELRRVAVWGARAGVFPMPGQQDFVAETVSGDAVLLRQALVNIANETERELVLAALVRLGSTAAAGLLFRRLVAARFGRRVERELTRGVEAIFAALLPHLPEPQHEVETDGE